MHYWPAYIRAPFCVRFNFGQSTQFPIGRILSYSQFSLFWTILWRIYFTYTLGCFSDCFLRIKFLDMEFLSQKRCLLYFWHIILQKFLCQLYSQPQWVKEDHLSSFTDNEYYQYISSLLVSKAKALSNSRTHAGFGGDGGICFYS